MFSLKRARREKPVLIADVEGGSVAVGVALLKTGAPARILVHERAYISAADRAQEHHTVAVTTLFRDTLSRVLKHYTESPEARAHSPIADIHVVVGTPWVRSRSVISKEEYPHEVVITDAAIKNAAKQALKQPSPLNESNIFESSVTRVQLNGYPTGKPVGKRAHHLSVTAFQSEMVGDMKRGIEALVNELLPGRTIHFRSATRAALTTLHEHAHTNHFFFIAVGSTDTECIAVHKEDTNEHASLSVGTSHVVQRLAGDQGLPDEVFSLLRMLMADTCAAPACGALVTNLAKLEPELVKMFGDAFALVAAHRKIPNTCFLAAQPDFAPWLEHFFARIDFAQFTVTAQPLSITLLTPEHLRDRVTWAGAHEDTGLCLATAFVNTLND